MEAIKAYLSNPSTWIAFTVFVFGLGATYTTMSFRINNIEDHVQKVEMKVDSIDVIGVQTQLASIQSDLAWIKNALQSK